MSSATTVENSLQQSKPETVGLCSKRLGNISRHIEKRYLEPGHLPGTLTLVARGGRTAFLNCQGMADVEQQKPVREDTQFRIYSMTKPVTSVALMMLYEACHFQLMDPVHRYSPEFRNLRVYASGIYPNYLTTPTNRQMRMSISGINAPFAPNPL